MQLSLEIKGRSFSDIVNARVEEVQERIASTIKLFALTLHSTLVQITPYATGQAKGNWQVAIDSAGSEYLPDELLHPPETFDYQAYSAEAQSVIESYQAGQVLYVFNNLPYISALNRGSSTQAPAGFAESAVQVAFAAIGQG